jgi:uncharacterized protein (TIGR03118 family)
MSMRSRCVPTSPAFETLEPRQLLSEAGGLNRGQFFTQTNLASDIPGLAAHLDPKLKNPWGMSFGPTTPIWVSDNMSGFATLYAGDGTPQALQVTIPGADGIDGDGMPTGQVFNSTASSFVVSRGGKSGKATFIFAGEDGVISGWSPAVSGNHAVIAVNVPASNAVYKGLALAQSGGQDYLYAADFHNGRIDVFNSSFAPQNWAGAFSDKKIPAGFAPFNVQNLGGNLYVTYAKQDADAHDDVAGAGNGFVDEFDTAGHLIKRFEHVDALNSPWGVAIAPDSWGKFGGNLLVGQFGSGQIAAFNRDSGHFHGLLRNKDGTPVQNDGLWGLAFGNGARGTDTNTLYFTAGLNDEADGLFGSLSINFGRGSENNDLD